MAGRMIVAVTKANPGVKKARAATGRAVRIGASKGTRVGARIMARGRSGRGRPSRSSTPARPSLPTRSRGSSPPPAPNGAAASRGRAAANGPAVSRGRAAPNGPAVSRGRATANGTAVSRGRAASNGPAPKGPAKPVPAPKGRSASKGSAPRLRRPLVRRRPPPAVPSGAAGAGPSRPRRPLVRRRVRDGDGGGGRRLLRPFRRRDAGPSETRSRRQKHRKSLLYRTLNARKLRRRRRLRWLLGVVAVTALFVASMGMFGATSQSAPEGAEGVPIGFVDGIPYADVFNGTVSLGVDPRLVAAIAFVGSGFAPDVITCARPSPSGRLGIMQLLPDVAAGLGVDPCDPAQAIPAAARHLLAQHTAFGTWELALAAYHAGPSAVTTFGGIPPYPQTAEFVPNVVAQWNAYMAEFPSGSLGTEAPYGPLGSTARYTESRITPTMQHFLDVVVPIFGQGYGIGCYRQQQDGEHPQGRACDFIMQRPLNQMPTQQYLEHGWAFVNYVIAHAADLKLRYVIWQKQIWQEGIGWHEYTRYDPSGNLQQNHYDHVHVTVNW